MSPSGNSNFIISDVWSTYFRYELFFLTVLFLTYQWEPQHDSLSCEAFAEWKVLNDPVYQREHLSAYLEEFGIGNGNCLFQQMLHT